MAERDAAAARVFRKHPSGTPRVAVRPNYVGLPFSGLDGTGRARRKPRARAGEEPVVRVAEATAPRCKVAAAERRVARVRRTGRPAARRGLEKGRCSALRSLTSGETGKWETGNPAARKQNCRVAKHWLKWRLECSAGQCPIIPPRLLRGGWKSECLRHSRLGVKNARRKAPGYGGGDSRARPGGAKPKINTSLSPPGRSLTLASTLPENGEG